MPARGCLYSRALCQDRGEEGEQEEGTLSHYHSPDCPKINPTIPRYVRTDTNFM